MRKHNENVFVDIMHNRVALEQPFDDVLFVIIDDVRFDNEAKWINENGGRVFGLVRDGVDYTREHLSECPIHWQLMRSQISNNQANNAASFIFYDVI